MHGTCVNSDDYHGWPVGKSVGCDKRQRRHTTSVFFFFFSLLVTTCILSGIVTS